MLNGDISYRRDGPSHLDFEILADLHASKQVWDVELGVCVKLEGTYLDRSQASCKLTRRESTIVTTEDAERKSKFRVEVTYMVPPALKQSYNLEYFSEYWYVPQRSLVADAADYILRVRMQR